MTREHFVFEYDEKVIHDIINAGWDSILFGYMTPSAILMGPSGTVALEVGGSVNILDKDSDISYTEHSLHSNNDLVSIIKSGAIQDSSRFEVDNNMEFNLVYYDEDNRIINSGVFKELPNSINDLRTNMIDFYNYYKESAITTWVRETIYDDMINEIITADLSDIQVDKLVDVVVSDEYLWQSISEALHDIYDDLERGEYPHIINTNNRDLEQTVNYDESTY